MTKSDHAFDLIEGVAPTVNPGAAARQGESDAQSVLDIHRPALQEIAAPFSADNARLSGLTTWRSGKKIAPLHVLADDVWISFAADAAADIDVHPSSDLEGLVIDVNDIGASPWISLSWRIDREAVRRGRYFCFVIK